ncbi:hypothetical protein Moror_1889 [Moniliophthora roreri MCA 2997]|uniref:Uncharacterized protein n=2 Tax=Moniliophthora roreri TaxID=221103 RepID=V2X1J3_MONRO|nr:hypothetical protein Moror_1889 [Moniliophthora roreri MCA 2997]
MAEALTLGLVFGIPNSKLIGTNEPFPNLFICADADPADGSHWLVYYWMSILVIDIILLCLALYQAWKHRPSKSGSPLMRALTRDAVVYFLIIVWIYLANLVMWIINRITLNELCTPFSFVISSVLANRMLISVRERHFLIRNSEMRSYMYRHAEWSKEAATEDENVEPILTTVFATETTASQYNAFTGL